MTIITDKRVLHQVSTPVKKVDMKFVEKLVSTVRNNKCIALSAIQVGKPIRMFAMKFENEILVFVNPEIVQSSGSFTSTETCLSVPGQKVQIKRPTTTKITAMTPKGKHFLFTGERLYSACICHEIDHLNGILIGDNNGQ